MLSVVKKRTLRWTVDEGIVTVYEGTVTVGDGTVTEGGRAKIERITVSKLLII